MLRQGGGRLTHPPPTSPPHTHTSAARGTGETPAKSCSGTKGLSWGTAGRGEPGELRTPSPPPAPPCPCPRLRPLSPPSAPQPGRGAGTRLQRTEKQRRRSGRWGRSCANYPLVIIKKKGKGKKKKKVKTNKKPNNNQKTIKTTQNMQKCLHPTV